MSCGDDHRRLLEVRREQLRRLYRQSFAAFCAEVLHAQGRTSARHHRYIINELKN
jgi:hypothetical protein